MFFRVISYMSATGSFSSLGLVEPLLRAVADKGYSEPSPIQAQGIPAVLTGADVMAAAQTGTGKTAGFTLPLLQLLAASAEKGAKVSPNRVRALVLTPTRELAAQVQESVKDYSRYLPRVKSAVVFGGVKINPQIAFMRGGVDVLVATPGRLLDLYQQGVVKFNELEVLILDEADRMLDMGFIRDIKRIMSLLPQNRQTLLYSATFSGEIRTLAEGLLKSPVQVDVSPRNSTAPSVTQWLHPVDKSEKTALLCHLMKKHDWQQVLVFTRTKHGANKLVEKLIKAGLSAAAIHGNKSQGARTRALSDFKKGEVRALVATDIAARGLDIEQLPQVVNFELPSVAEDYVHRIGRTGRAGAKGKAISLVCADEAKQLAGIERLIKSEIKREIIDGFEPDHRVPSVKPGAKPASKFRNKPSGAKNKPSNASKRPRKAGPKNNTRNHSNAGAGARRDNSGNR